MPDPVTKIGDHHETDHQKIQAHLTVEQIMTPRSAFLCCPITSSIGEAFSDVPDVYDAVPVVDGDAADIAAEIVGVVWRRDLVGAKRTARIDSLLDEWPLEKPVRTSTPMLDYAREASSDRLTFISDGDSVVGLATIYDLERLPVRLSLFQHLLYLEQRLGQVIATFAPEADWPDLAPRKREEIQIGIRRSKQRDHLGSAILGIGFTEKVEIARNLLPKILGPDFKTNLLDFVAPFRNDVAHGLPFRRVEEVPTRVCEIDALISHLNDPRILANF